MAGLPGEIALNAAVNLATALAYVYVGQLTWKRRLGGDAKVATRLFGVWWASLGILNLASALLAVPTALGLVDLAVTITFVYAILVLLAVALWGLVYYMLYLYTGNARLFWPVTAAYALVAVGLVYLLTWLHPIALDPGTFTTGLQYERELPRPAALVVSLLVTGPALLAVLAYGSLYFRVQGPTERYRIGLVSGAFVAWLSWSLLSSILQLAKRYPDSLALLVVNHALALLAPLLVLLAYRPPAAWRARHGIEAVE